MIYRLPFPVSVNAMYRNVHGRGRVKSRTYLAWVKEAELVLARQRPRPFIGLAMLDIRIDSSRRGDCSNYIKGVEDFLVSSGILQDDQKKYVRSVSIAWADVKGCEVRLSPAE